MADVDDEIQAAQQSRGIGFAELSTEDDVYTKDRFAGLETSIGPGEEAEDDGAELPSKRATFTAPQHLLADVPRQEEEPLKERSNRIADREDEYHARRQRIVSPDRADPFALGDKTPDVSNRSYKDVMAENSIAREREELKRKLAEQEKEREAAAPAGGEAKKRRRWCVRQHSGFLCSGHSLIPYMYTSSLRCDVLHALSASSHDKPLKSLHKALLTFQACELLHRDQPTAPADKAKTRWDNVATPAPVGSKWDATPTPGRDTAGVGSRWDATPTPGRAVDSSKWDATPTPGRVVDSSKWDATPTPGRVMDASKWDATPTPGRLPDTSKWDATPTPGRAVDGSKW
eukprot:4376916-Pleurochrysis_carterae.AAC.2